MLRIAIGVVVALMIGSVAFVIHHEKNKTRPPREQVADEADQIVTISTGDRVDVDARVPRSGLTIVEFTAVW